MVLNGAELTSQLSVSPTEEESGSLAGQSLYLLLGVLCLE